MSVDSLHNAARQRRGMVARVSDSVNRHGWRCSLGAVAGNRGRVALTSAGRSGTTGWPRLFLDHTRKTALYSFLIFPKSIFRTNNHLGQQPQVSSKYAGKRLLIVDDDADMRLLLAEYFRRLGFQVEERESGVEALEPATTGRFDCFIFDVSMPGMTGFELLQRVRIAARRRRRSF